MPTQVTQTIARRLNAVSGVGSGLVAVNATNVLSGVGRTTASGTSSSGTPGTSIAQIAAAAGNQFVCINAVATSPSTAASNLTITVVYSDTTSTSDTTAAAANAQAFVNDACIFKWALSGATAAVTPHSAKKITSITITTLGAGTGVRTASIAAIEIPQ